MSEEWPSYPGATPDAFSADPTAMPALRASHADRALAGRILDQAYDDGRLSPAEYASRRDSAAKAVTLGDLGPLVADVNMPTVVGPDSSRLPVPYADPDPVRPEPTPVVIEKSRRVRRGFLGLPAWWIKMTVTMILIWLITGVGAGGWSSFWPMWPILGTLLYLVLTGGIGRRGRAE